MNAEAIASTSAVTLDDDQHLDTERGGNEDGSHNQYTTTAKATTIAPTLSTETSTNRLRPWKKVRESSTSNTQKSKKLSKTWERRTSERKREDAIRQLEKTMKDEKQAEMDQRKQTAKERQEKLAEKQRLEDAAKKYSAKKLQRMKKRLNRSKLVKG